MPEVTIQQAFELAVQHHQAGRLSEAEALYRQILAVQPGHADALHHLGIIAHQVGRPDLALDWIRQANTLDPHNASAHDNLGEVYRALGRMDEATASYRRAIELQPAHVGAHLHLAGALQDAGRFDEAVAAYRRALEFQPDFAAAHYNLGNALKDCGRLDEAIAEFREALRCQVDYVEAYNNLGNALKDRGQIEEAIVAYRGAVQLQPNLPEMHHNLSNALREGGDLDEAESACRRALELRPQYAEAWNNLGNIRKDQGQVAEAVDAYRRALSFRPEQPWVHSNLIYALHLLPRVDDRAIAEEQERWNRQFGAPVQPTEVVYVNDRHAERRLRVGYVSADFRDHVVGRNLRPLFRHHTREDFEIFCYAGVARADGLTDEFRGRADRWRNVAGVADEALARMIREDEVDILVDLAQHTAGNRLPVFGRRPAPVQVSFMGYPDSAGVEGIGYRLSDRWLEESGPDVGLGRERVLLLESFWCYDPCGAEAKPNALPADENYFITFGGILSFPKLNCHGVNLWAKIIRRTKDARLLLLSREGSHRLRTMELFEREGIAAHRVEFVEPCARQAYLELFHRVDVALDSFPYNGHNTSLDALWMGVPVVSLAGKSRVARGGLSILTNVGAPELVARSDDEYVEIASRLADDLPRLSHLRSTLRQRMESSVLMDAPRFASQIEAAFRRAWQEWCAKEANA